MDENFSEIINEYREIISIINENSGISEEEIIRKSGKSRSEIIQILLKLIDKKIVTSIRFSGVKYYYVEKKKLFGK